MAYRILLLNGPLDGDDLVAEHPWYEVTLGKGYVYKAVCNEEGQPIVEEGDAGSGTVECITLEGSFTPSIQTIRMHYSHSLTGGELEKWKKDWEKYGFEI